jgi:hypothetical protein
MKYHETLARWANGDNAFTALALAGKLDVKARADVGISGKALRDELARGKSDVTLTLQCAALTNDVALLRRLARERRVAVRTQAMGNVHMPIDALEDALVGEKNWDVRYAASESLKRRIKQMSVDEAVALLEAAKSTELVEEVAQRTKITDAHVLALLPKSLMLKNRWGYEQPVRVADYVADRSDLKRFSDETILEIAKETTMISVTRHCVAAQRSDALWMLLTLVEKGAHSACRPSEVLRELARAKTMDEAFYERVLNAADDRAKNGVTASLAENADAPWQLLEEETVVPHTAAAVGRALQEMFVDAPAVWLLALKLMENTTTVREVLGVVRAVHPEHLRD